MKHNRSLRKTLLFTYIFLLFITLIPSVYSVLVFQIHTAKYNQIISNVGRANKISAIAREEIPAELWNIICGKKDISEVLFIQNICNINGVVKLIKSNTT